MENKNPPRQSHPSPNRNFNPQYRIPPLQLLQRERNELQDHIQPPLYLEEDPKEHVEETIEVQENPFFSLSDEEHEIKAHEEEGDDLDAPLDDGEVNNYCIQFDDFMQALLHKKYELQSSRKISRRKEKN